MYSVGGHASVYVTWCPMCELRELSTTDLKFLEDGLEGAPGATPVAACDPTELDTILDDLRADTHLLLTNPDSLLDGKYT